MVKFRRLVLENIPIIFDPSDKHRKLGDDEKKIPTSKRAINNKKHWIHYFSFPIPLAKASLNGHGTLKDVHEALRFFRFAYQDKQVKDCTRRYIRRLFTSQKGSLENVD
ncbi:hypothetical protein G9A89_007913 [Geosiphon pyriformis]|nr:hypothetical protein G9A89_007913 [Geosiphon pyriformis]